MAFKATLGGQVDPARRDAEYWTKAEWNVRTLHSFTHAEPFWVVEALGITRWYNAANEAAKAVERFIKGNHEALAGPGPL